MRRRTLLSDENIVDNTKAFRQHGFVKKGKSGNNIYGDCIFCGKEDRFYINTENKKWDCKSASCGKSGGFQTFLREVVSLGKQYFRGDKAVELARAKGLKVSTLRSCQVGYNPNTLRYSIPVYEMDGETLYDVRTYDLKTGKPFTTAGCHPGLYGWPMLADKSRTGKVWIVEGAWDWATMIEIFSATDNVSDVVVGTPSASVFPAEWAQIFSDRDVTIVYDNDHDKIGKDGAVRLGAGKKATERVYNLLKDYCDKLSIVIWPDDFADGYDVRDLYHDAKRNPNKTLKALDALASENPPTKAKESVSVNSQDDIKGKGVLPKDVYKVYKKWLHMEDTTVIDLLYGSIIANRWDINPVWLLLVGPSGCGKSELIMSVSEAPRTYTTSDLTSKSLVSGFNIAGGHDPSLIPLLNGKVLLVKDLTPLLKAPITERDQVLSYFRDSYDGRIQKKFGHVYRDYVSRYGFVAGVTPIIEVFSGDAAAFGERFLRWNFISPKCISQRKDFARRAYYNTSMKMEMQNDLRKIGTKALTCKFDKPKEPSNRIVEKLLSLSEFIAILRGTVTRERYTNEILHKPFVEYTTRLSTQLNGLMGGIAGFHHSKQVSEEHYKKAKHVAISSVPSRMESLIRGMWFQKKQDNAIGLNNLSDIMGLPRLTTQRVVEDMVILGSLRKEKLSAVREVYRLSDDTLQIIKESEVYADQKPLVRRRRRNK